MAYASGVVGKRNPIEWQDDLVGFVADILAQTAECRVGMEAQI